MSFNQQELIKISKIAHELKENLIKKYGNTNDAMMGKCIEASDTLVMVLDNYGIKARAKQVWCLYEYFENCSNYCYEEHWIVEIYKNKDKRYIDLTMNQFQWAFSKKLPSVYMSSKLPNFYLTRKPGKGTLDKCGWNDWYNYGDYENKFDYWGKKK